MEETNWVVITGGPSSGKSTLLACLENQGYKIVFEVARIIIDREIAGGKTLGEIRADEAEFQRRVLQMKIDIEEKLLSQQLTFLDRGIPDSIAYNQICRADVTLAFEASRKRRYRAVFHCEQVPFEQDHARTEDQKKAHEISTLLHKAYTDLGYEVIGVPLMSTEERAKFILKELNRL